MGIVNANISNKNATFWHFKLLKCFLKLLKVKPNFCHLNTMIWHFKRQCLVRTRVPKWLFIICAEEGEGDYEGDPA